ncbi:MAG: agmatine deiminase family protein [Chthoniobacterales bacterium]
MRTLHFAPNTPAALGYRMPAEWELHNATWLSWPRREGISFPDSYDNVMPAFICMVDALRESEPVRINVRDAEHEKEVRLILKEIDSSHVEFFHIPTNEPWCRDHGPMFIRREREPRLAVVDWDYNAWGGKYPPFDLDEVVPTKIARHFALPVYYPKLVMEGGSIDLNGTGALLTTTSCLLNPNRNPTKSKDDIERALRDYLGATHFLWLGDGIEGDDTDGHIDDITRFVDRSTVLTAIEEDPADENQAPLQSNRELLEKMTIEDGTPLTVIPLPMPSRVEKEGRRLPASYLNFYIANRVVLLPIFNSPNDRLAIETLEACFPSRRIVPIDCRELVWGLGAFHCLTQQQPALL